MPPIWCVSMVRCCGTWVRQRWVEKKGKHFRRWLFWFKVMLRKMVLEMICISTSISYRIHGTFGIFTYHQHHKKSSSHVGNHSSHTHAMGNRYFAGSGHTSESESIGGKEICGLQEAHHHMCRGSDDFVPSWWGWETPMPCKRFRSKEPTNAWCSHQPHQHHQCRFGIRSSAEV